jgi:hypothetical protein
MIRGSISKALLPTFLVAAVAVAAMPVRAGSAGNGYPAFPSEAMAQQYCPNDVVVWATGDHFYMKGSPSYAKVDGFYACMADVKKVGMQPGP